MWRLDRVGGAAWRFDLHNLRSWFNPMSRKARLKLFWLNQYFAVFLDGFGY